jgi:hypothetical protein
MKKWLFLLAPILFCLSSRMVHAFEIPRDLSQEDRHEVVRTLGLNSSTKMLSNPFPLGGYSGLEVGYSVEFINVRDIQRLGCASAGSCAASSENEWRYSRITIGKGLYNDVDLFLHFIPPTGNVRVSDYGGAIRWSFFQAEFLPINVSAIAHANQLNFDDDFVSRNVGFEIIAGVNVDNFGLYFGGGMLRSSGTFMGDLAGTSQNGTVDESDPSLNQYSNTVTHNVQGSHTVVGFVLNHKNLFTAAQVDRYEDAVYSLKMGVRY